jgi:hypothetical protein
MYRPSFQKAANANIWEYINQAIMSHRFRQNGANALTKHLPCTLGWPKTQLPITAY